jgi:hypothetical protein
MRKAPDANKELALAAAPLVERLVAVIGRLRENEAEFVSSMHEKFGRYGADTYVSDKQLKWLKDLDRQHAPDPRQVALF